MGLSLTSTAAFHLRLDALDDACRGRGLDGVEVVLSAKNAPEALVAEASASGARVTALRCEELDESFAPVLARCAARLNVPVSVASSVIDPSKLREYAEIFAAQNARLLLSVETDLTQALETLAEIRRLDRSPTLGVAWEVRPSSEALDDAGAVLFAIREELGLVRLFGGGPEQHDQDGQGVGSVLVDLALSRYTGPIVLCPSRRAELPRWSKWLASRKPAGCGSRAGSKEVLVDVRGVEPRDRLETILGAYRSLVKGATLELTVDHDPSCMYYMLEATEPPGSFTFRKTEDGPVVWRAEVTRT